MQPWAVAAAIAVLLLLVAQRRRRGVNVAAELDSDDDDSSGSSVGMPALEDQEDAPPPAQPAAAAGGGRGRKSTRVTLGFFSSHSTTCARSNRTHRRTFNSFFERSAVNTKGKTAGGPPEYRTSSDSKLLCRDEP